MTLEHAEEVAQYVVDVRGFVPRINAAIDLLTLARALLALLPVVRAAEAYVHAELHEDGDASWRAEARLMDAIGAMRLALEVP